LLKHKMVYMFGVLGLEDFFSNIFADFPI